MPEITSAGNSKFPGRGDKMYDQARKDPYQSRKKMPDPARCPDCGAVFLKGRWTWETVAEPVTEELCPACKRIRERVAAGVLNISGPFFAEHRDEIESLITNTEKLEKERHPLERLMGIKANEDGIRVETTGLHLARRIGDVLNDAYQGDLNLEYLKGEYKVRVDWKR